MTPENFLAWQRIDFTPVQSQVIDDAPRTTALPVAGVLTIPAFLNGWETTPTLIDPIAGGFRGFDEQNTTRFRADDKWHDGMFPPGVNALQMPPTNYGNAIMWLGADPARPALRHLASRRSCTRGSSPTSRSRSRTTRRRLTSRTASAATRSRTTGS